ncbi:MAG: ABC transporter ATP-binding protein/permease [Clostridiales bacterium]|nr:ABC transporter ATP-binding protein/permease [Clostridiales bacterium]
MLELKEITKDYKVGGDKVRALKGVSIKFRKSEFVSVLGPSGCGKTTLLNIIGGLDHCTDGDLIINGISTKTFKDRDWDTYRNHSIGFVFQSYNLIPHQTILENVELALNISGIPKAERVQRAKEALDKVGLAGLYKKKPNQLSGGQMQRVAIARALVGDPDILLADEPTGALDSETSVQIMDLIKEISLERLVIMVTHNPELAEQYSTRIVRLLDGLVVDDTMPYDGGEEAQAEKTEAEGEEQGTLDNSDHFDAPPVGETSDKVEKSGKSKKSKLSFWSTFKLSFRNLLTKLKRTILVCFAGSIGIIGVTTVLAVSTGVTDYIDQMQNDMLSGNPIQVKESSLNLSLLTEMSSIADERAAAKKGIKKGHVNVDYMIEFLANRADDLNELMVSNTITNEYVEFVKNMPKSYYREMSFRYGIDVGNNIYTDYHFTKPDGSPDTDGKKMSLTAAQEIYTSLLGKTIFSKYSQMASLVKIDYRQAPENEDFISQQYDIISENGRIATKAGEVMIVVDKDTQLTDLFLAQLGYYNQEEFLNIAYKATKDTDPDSAAAYDPKLDRDRIPYGELVGKKFTWYPNDTVYNYIADDNPAGWLETNRRAFTYNPIASDEWTDGIELTVTAILRPKKDLAYGSMSAGIYYTPALINQILERERVKQSKIVEFLAKDEEGLGVDYFTVPMGTDEVYVVPTFDYEFYYDGVLYSTTSPDKKTRITMGMVYNTPGMNDMMSMFSGGAMASLSLRDLGGIDIPNTISVYPIDFTYKGKVTKYLDKWNKAGAVTFGETTIERDDREDIIYTDNIELIISLVNDLIDMITFALVAFTSLSLVVSTVMIAIITYVSVIERIKEIGVIRALGGRKRDVSRLFTAETLMIGIASGVLGIIVTFILTLIINGIVQSLAGISIASLTVPIALIMISVSAVLTLISGLVPARLAAKKDPVEALRTE